MQLEYPTEHISLQRLSVVGDNALAAHTFN